MIIAEPAPQPLAFAAATTSQDTAVLPASQSVPVLALPMQWSRAFKPCALAAMVASILMYLGLHPFVAMLSVGFLAVVFYRQLSPGISVKPMVGAGIGALSGVFWFALSSAFEALIVIFLHKGPELRTALIAKIQEVSSQTTDPQVLAIFDRVKTPSGLEFLMLMSLVFAFIASIVLGGMGGAIGGAILGRRNRS